MTRHEGRLVHPIMQGFPAGLGDPDGRPHCIEKLWPNAKAVATAVSPEEGVEYPMTWVYDCHGACVRNGRGTRGRGDPTFRDLLARGFKWAVNEQ